jgi:hypothetical protein
MADFYDVARQLSMNERNGFELWQAKTAQLERTTSGTDETKTHHTRKTRKQVHDGRKKVRKKL